MSKHTPGPWVYQDKTENCGGFSVFSGHQFVAFVGDSDGKTPAKANARLIAAAPELLEALEAFLRAPHIGSDGPGSSTIVVQEFNLRAARKVVAQARGEE